MPGAGIIGLVNLIGAAVLPLGIASHVKDGEGQCIASEWNPSIIYRVAAAPSRLLRRGVLPLGIGASKKGR
jgi:hypothetical protein